MKTGKGKEFGWRGFALAHGYFIIADSSTDLQGICEIDDMGTFKTATAAEAQAARDGFKFIPLTKQQVDIINSRPIASYVLTEDHILNTPRNRRLLKGII